MKLPEGIFEGVKAWDQTEKQAKVRAFLATLEIAAIFRSGKLPKNKPKGGYIHSTCGCWQCLYCTRIIVKRAMRDERRERWAAG